MKTLLLSALLGAAATQDAATPKVFEVFTPVQATWLPASFEDSSAVRAAAATQVTRVLDAEGRPLVSDRELRDRGLDQVRRTFLLEGDRFLSGEPLAVEYRVSVRGEAIWRENVGGNYRGRGRDESFRLLMQHEDGTWIGDAYGDDEVYSMGGLSVEREVRAGEPLVRWVPVQRWCGLERPGRYTLHCLREFTFGPQLGCREAVLAQLPAEVRTRYEVDDDGSLIDLRSGRAAQEARVERRVEWREAPPSPVYRALPEALRTRLGPAAAGSLVAWASFELEIVEAEPAERQAMVERVRTQMQGGSANNIAPDRADALFTAAMFSRGTDFLDDLRAAAEADPTLLNSSLGTALAQNPSPEALAMLLGAESATALLNQLRMLHPAHRPAVIPRLVEWLSDPDDARRMRAESQLHRWTGQAFGRDWTGWRSGRPTLEEGRAMQPMWQAWWEQQRDGG